MRAGTPSTFATWLLETFGSERTREALSGDLIEQYRHGRRLWYWRQVLAAIVASSMKDVRTHKLLAVRTGILGLASLTLWGLAGAFFQRLLAVLSNGGYYIGSVRLWLPDHW